MGVGVAGAGDAGKNATAGVAVGVGALAVGVEEGVADLVDGAGMARHAETASSATPASRPARTRLRMAYWDWPIQRACR